MADGAPIVLDNGGGTIKVGFTGYERPTLIPNIVGYPRSDGEVTYFGNEALSKHGEVKIVHPIEGGSTSDFNATEKIWQYTISNVLNVSPSEHPLLLTGHNGMIYEQAIPRSRATQIAFESLQSPSFYPAIPGVLALHSSGRTTGTVFSSGYSRSDVVSVYEGKALRDATTHLDVSGEVLTDLQARYLSENHTHVVRNMRRVELQALANNIKEKLCYVAAEDFSEECKKTVAEGKPFDRPFTLPDGKEITIRVADRFCGPEALFNTNHVGLDQGGAHVHIFNSIMRSHKELHSNLFSNIVLSGGTTLFPGLVERFTYELNNLRMSSQAYTAQVTRCADPITSVWVGGSILASMGTFKDMSISKAEYEEHGADIVEKRCF